MRVNVVALLLLLLLLVFFVLDGSSTAAAATATQLWAAANSEWALGRVDETLALLLQIEHVDPDDSMLPMALGAVYQSKVRACVCEWLTLTAWCSGSHT